jgi:soluble lytic murein transglycosylase-like protein
MFFLHLLKMMRLKILILFFLALTYGFYDSEVKTVKPEKVKVSPNKAPFAEIKKEEFSKEDKVLAELIAQMIVSQKCSADKICKYIPEKQMSWQNRNRFNYSKITQMQNLSYEDAVYSLKSVGGTGLIENYKKFLQGPCPRNLSAAWLKKNESEIRKNHEDKMMEMYNFVKECKVESSHEEMYLRQALFFYHQNKISFAQEAITKALEVAHNDRMRIFYWAGIILKNNDYLWEVILQYPYSFHAINAADKNFVDLFNLIIQRPNYSLERSNHEIVSYVELLLHFEKYKELDKFLRLNIKNSQIDNHTWFYILRIVNQQAPINYGIYLTARLAQNKPFFLNQQVLEMAYQEPFMELFTINAEEFDFNPYLVLSLSKQESAFNQKASSVAKAKGLMQILPATARQMEKVTAQQLLDPNTNIKLGTKYLYHLYQRYNQIEPALAAYNAGPHRVDNWLKIYSPENTLLFLDLIPFKETRSYVSLILRNHYFYLNFNPHKEKGLKSKLIEDLVR